MLSSKTITGQLFWLVFALWLSFCAWESIDNYTRDPFFGLTSNRFDFDISPSKSQRNQFLSLTKEYTHFTRNNTMNASAFLETIENLPDFLFYVIFYHKAQSAFYLKSTKNIIFDESENPFNRFLKNNDYCFQNFIYVMYKDPEFKGSEIGFEYTMTSVAKDFIRKSFGGNNWPSPYTKKPKKDEERNLSANYNAREDFVQNIAPIYELDPKIKTFYTYSHWFSSHQVGNHFACMFQAFNHLPGRSYISLKSRFADISRRYAKAYEGKQQCFKPGSLIPETFILKKAQECKAFFAILDDPIYQERVRRSGPKFIRKITSGMHRGSGVEVVDAKEEFTLRELYGNGTNCGLINDSIIIQAYIDRPLLVEGHKFDFRVYLHIASVEPLIVLFHDGFLKVSLFDYDPLSTNKATHITSSEISLEFFKRVEEGENIFNKTSQELRDFQVWSFQRLHEYLMKVGKVTDPDWVDNFLRPSFRRAMAHIAQIAFKFIAKAPNLYEVFGVDFMLDEDFNLWHMESNVNPEFTPTNEYKEVFFHTLVKENIEIAFIFLKSRAKRVLEYIRNLKEQVLEGIPANSRDIEGVMEMIEKRIDSRAVRKALKELSRNKLEEGFGIPEGNTYQWVVDYSQSDPEMVFKGLLDKECILDWKNIKSSESELGQAEE